MRSVERRGVRHSDVQYAVRFNDAADFAEGSIEFREMLQAVIADHEIEGSRRKRHAGGIGEHIRALDQRVGPLQIEPDHQNVAAWTEETARTGAEIEHACSGWEVSDEIEHRSASIITCKICIFSIRWCVIELRVISDPNSGLGAAGSALRG